MNSIKYINTYIKIYNKTSQSLSYIFCSTDIIIVVQEWVPYFVEFINFFFVLHILENILHPIGSSSWPSMCLEPVENHMAAPCHIISPLSQFVPPWRIHTLSHTLSLSIVFVQDYQSPINDDGPVYSAKAYWSCALYSCPFCRRPRR